MYTYTIIILGILVFGYILYNTIYYSEVKYVRSSVDGKYYRIRRGNNQTDEFLRNSADTLATINRRVMTLISYLELTYHNDDTRNYFIRKLRQNYNYHMISEAAVDPRYTTYTVNKTDMHICLRSRDQYEKIYDIDTLMYVILHELAHVSNYKLDGTPIEGHEHEFKMIFKFLVEQAIKIGIYEYINYEEHPQEYCGIIISSSII